MKKLIICSLLAASFGLMAEVISAELQQNINMQDQLPLAPGTDEVQGVVNFATVANSGPDINSCDFRIGGTVIQDAIDDGANYDEIRIVNGTYPENLTLADRNITIKGGYASCADAINDNMVMAQDSVSTTIQPVQPSSGPVIQITDGDANSRETVTLTNIRITGGINDGFLTAGGISTLIANLQLNLNHVWIDGNEGLLGGGLAVVGGNTDVYARNLMLLANTATDSGGGLYCDGAEASVFIDYLNPDTDGFGIVVNVAEGGDGGGVYLTNGCQFTSYVGTNTLSLGGPLDLRGLFGNTATENGGGVAVSGGSTANFYGNLFCFFSCNGNNEDPVSITSNTADSDDNSTGSGGGIYVTGANSIARLSNGLINANVSHRGGGVAVDDTASFESNSIFTSFFTGYEVDCWSPGSCTQIKDNNAANYAGGLEFLNGTTGEIVHTHITGNRANNVTALYARNANTTVDVNTSLIANNGDGGANGFNDSKAIRQFDNSTLNIAFTTIADNDVVNTVIENNTASINVGSSIIHQSNGSTVYAESAPVANVFDCVMANEVASIPGGFFVIADDPEFVDRNNGDFHLNENISPAVDYCDDGGTPADFNDIDNQQRPWDWSNISNNLGPFDLGFDETSDLIFKDGFEAPTTPL